MFITKANLRSVERGGSGALSAFLAETATRIGQAHHLVWTCYETQEGRPFLYRMTGPSPRQPILIVSEIAPKDHHSLWDMEVKPYTLRDNLRDGDRLHWSLRINAVVSRRTKEGASRSTKHCIVDHARQSGAQGHNLDIAMQVLPQWLKPRLANNGLDCDDEKVVVESYSKMQFARSPVSDPHTAHRPSGKDSIRLGVSDVIGSGTVTDAVKLRELLVKGLGHGRGYGCGLLLVRRAA